MKILYLFSSPEGDLPIHGTALKLPLRITPHEIHAFMTVVIISRRSRILS